MSGHIVSSFDQDLKNLSRIVLEMGRLTKGSVNDSIASLSSYDTWLAETVIAMDTQIDKLQKEVEDLATLMIARRQPMAHDLREIIASMRIAWDLERIGDLAKNIAKRVKNIDNPNFVKQQVLGVESLANKSTAQLSRILSSFASGDHDEALAVWHADDEIDELYTSLFRELLMYMMEDTRTITFCTHLLFCAKNLERIGDHVTDIAESVYYSRTGEQMPTNL